MLAKYRNGAVPQGRGSDSPFATRFADLAGRVRASIFDLRFREALEMVWELVTSLNRAIDERKPWALFKEEKTAELDELLYDLAEGLRVLAMLLHPFMPERMEEMWNRLGAGGAVDAHWSQTAWGGLKAGTQTHSGDPLFPRVELAAVP
jgi:methionyl-tRNA synthetase